MPEYEVDLTTLVYGGDALGRLPDGRAVFVPYALPGERVRVRLVEEKRRHARAELVEVIQPSPERIAPRCAHFGQCGGCHYQHLPYSRQIEIKSAILRDQLERIAGMTAPPLRPVVPSPLPWNYRNAIQFSLTPQGQVGYQLAGSHVVFPIRECHLPEGALNDLWPRLEFEPDSGIQRIEMRLGAGEDVLVTLESEDPQPPPLELDLPISAVHIGPAGPLVLAGDDHTLIEIHGRPFRVSAGAFFQVNTLQAEAMVQHLLAILPKRMESVLDVYCGAGLFSAFLAPHAGRLAGIERSPVACEDFAANLDEFDNVELYQGAAEQILPALDLDPEVAIVDPPRAGLERPALDALLHMGPPTLIYVSCDPATLARDARRLLQAGYHLEHVTPFDLFPQTYAIESISLFGR